MSDLSTPAKPSSKADDRNVVPADGGPGASLEDRLFLFWKNYRTAIYGAIAVVLLVIVGREAWQVYVARREASIQTAFGLAESAEAKRAFARENAGHRLAGLALLAAADDAYAQADYARAGREYAEARSLLENPILSGRAQLGEAMSSLQGGDMAKGKSMLQALLDDANNASALRLEAGYQLAASAVAEGNHDVARATLEKLQPLVTSADWNYRLMDLAERIPAAPVVEPAPSAPAPAP